MYGATVKISEDSYTFVSCVSNRIAGRIARVEGPRFAHSSSL